MYIYIYKYIHENVKFIQQHTYSHKPLVTERRQQSGKKPVLCMWGQLSTIIRGREQSDQKSAYDGKIALAYEHN